MLLDTSGLLALLDAREPLHQKACEEYRRAALKITHGYVLAELVALGNARRVPPGKVLNFLLNLIANPDILVFWPDSGITSQAITLLLARQGRGFSLCDAVSFVLMKSKDLRESLTTDQHFEQEGFVRLLI